MLDKAVSMGVVSSEFVLTLDSDCFPVVDGWLSGLVGMMGCRKVAAAGVLHPWAPPPAGMDGELVEWRVRSQHCWDRTHVACQLVRTEEAFRCAEEGHGYASGDDTGLGLLGALLEGGRTCAGYAPTRCPLPALDFDPEFNRSSCVVYGDAVVHVGGYTRVEVGGDEPFLEEAFGWAVGRILEEKGAEFLLDDGLSYRYVFDREEEVARDKMRRMREVL